jgi:quinol monooxygenase YgiN
MKKSVNIYLMLCIMFSALVLSSCKTSPAGGEAQQVPAANVTGQELIIVAHISVYPEHRDEILKALEAVVNGTRTESGNIAYTLYEDASNPLKFTIIEYWKSQQAINEHNSTTHFNEFVKIIGGKADLDVHTMKHKY